MPIKESRWSTCKPKGIIIDYPSAKSLNYDSPVNIDMKVVAKYGQNSVNLVITKINPNGDFTATVQSFGPINISPPSDLSEGDEVLIDREHICWLLP